MGFFDFFRKKKLSHTEKAAAACQSCGPEAAERWFPGGPEEAADILSSLANICQVDLDRCGVREYGQLLRAYTDLADRETEGKPEDGGTAKEPAEFSNPFVRTPKTAREVLEYTAIHLRDRSFSVSGEEELRFLRGRVAAAEKQVAELKKNTEAELKLFASQSVEALKSEISDLITGEVVSTNINAAVADPAFMQKVILELVKNWPKGEFLSIQTSDAETLRSYFESNAKALLDKGCKIEKVNGKKASFAIVPADGSYKVTFGEEEFVEFFKEFLRPQLVDMLFKS